ncbi:hypothetical protein VM1G_01019 [Cytospora mali]|uniref:Uncharacterized protein n=1 Tax=Cytospora mali TaxID=578113 RepID=A0A194VMW5_CYTMA|nr:hypothetical protein VM1G_01019 [Valsa mali]
MSSNLDSRSNGQLLSPRSPVQASVSPAAQPNLGHRPGTTSSPLTPSRAYPVYDNVNRPLEEYHSGYGYTDEQQVEPAPLAPAIVHRTGHSRGQSLTNFLPASIRSKLQSPERPQQQLLPEADDMGLTGEGRKAYRQSAPLGYPMPQEPASEDNPSPETTPKRLVRSQTAGPIETASKTAAPAPAPAPARMSLLSMFTRNAPTEVTPAEHEELLSMKIEEALFPAGSPTGKDAFSPAAYKNLQQQATGLLNKMQNAYRQKAQALSHLEKEREADRDELEEAETRATHLKFQLEDMAHKAAEQEQRMKQLMEELSAERRARADDRNTLMKRLPVQSEAGSTISEDLGVDDAEEMQKRKWRKSNGTDTSFETDDDSISLEGESVFSRPRSPSTSTYTTTRGVETGSVIDMPLATPTSTRGPAPNRASVASNRKSTQMSTFQKLMKGISGDGSDGCRNCKGQDSSMAWDTVSLLRDENKHLKSRVGELEDCLEGALDVVNGIGL